MPHFECRAFAAETESDRVDAECGPSIRYAAAWADSFAGNATLQAVALMTLAARAEQQCACHECVTLEPS